MPDNGSAGMINVKNPGSSLTAAVGDGTADDTSAIQAIINHAAGTISNKVFFPPGEYLVNSDIVIPGSMELHGSGIGIAIIRATTLPYDNKINNAIAVSSVKLKNLYFDKIRVVFDHRQTKNITVDQCVFFSTAAIRNDKTRLRAQLTLKRLTSGSVHNCIFLRDSHLFGFALKFYKTDGVVVRDNVCGLDLSEIEWLSTEFAWTVRKQKLRFLKTHYNLAADQGYFNSCLHDGYDKNMRIGRNVLNGSPNTGTLKKDHAMYLKGFDRMEVSSNYVRGWPASASGGIKARNGKNLSLVRNYLDDTGILLYTHDPGNKPLYHGLKNVLIYGNHIVQRTNPDNRTSGISYYEPHWRSHSGIDENIKYSANEFEIVGVSNPNNYTCIWLTNGNLSHHHVYEDNVYFGTDTKVKLEARNAAPSFEPGSINASISAHYNRYPLYDLNIPIY